MLAQGASSRSIRWSLYVLVCLGAFLAGWATRWFPAWWLVLLGLSPLVLLLSICHVDWVYYAVLPTIPMAGWGSELPFITASVMNILLLFLGVILISQRFIRAVPVNRGSDHGPLVWLCGCFIAGNLISLLKSAYSIGDLRSAITALGQVLFIWVTVSVVTNKTRLERVIAIIIVGGMATATIALLQGIGVLGLILGMGKLSPGRYIGGIQLSAFRANSVFRGLGTFVVWLFLAFSLVSLGRPQFRSWMGRVVQFVLLGVFIGGLFVAQTRAGWIAFAFLVIALLAARWRYRLSHGIMFGLYVVVVLSIWVAPMILGYEFARIAALLVEMKSGSFYARLEQYPLAFQLILERPILGHGSYTFGLYSMEQIGQFKVLHNTFLSVLVSYGIVSGLPFFLLIFGSIWRALPVALDRSNASLADQAAALVVAMLAVLAQANFYGAVWDKTIWLLVGLLWSLPNVRAAVTPDSPGGKEST